MEELQECNALILDDDDDFCELIKKQCESMKIFDEIVIAKSPKAAKVSLVTDEFKFIFIDEHLDGESGIEFIRELIEDYDIKPKIILYASAEMVKDYALIALQLGVVTFLVKPTTKELLQERILGILKKPKKKAKVAEKQEIF